MGIAWMAILYAVFCLMTGRFIEGYLQSSGCWLKRFCRKKLALASSMIRGWCGYI